IADKTSVALSKDHLRRGAGRDQRMKSADRAARNGNEAEGENLSSEDRACAVDEARERRHQDLRPDKQDPRSKSKNGAGFDERAEIIARREKQPDWQRRSREAIRHDS